jgi:hypothetical protein
VEPSWPEVARNTAHLWLERHHIVGPRPAGRRRRLVFVLSALLAMTLGAGVTYAFTGPHQQESPAARPASPPGGKGPLQQAATDRQDAAAWIASEVSRSAIVSCDSQMCAQLQGSGFPAGQLKVLQPTDGDPLGSNVVVATPAVRNQFGARLAGVYAPLVIASFGTGGERIDVRAVAPDGTAAFQAKLAADRQARINAGRQLLNNKNVTATPPARSALLNGRVDPRLLITLSALAHKMPLQVIDFDDTSPGASSAVPLRGAEIGAAAAAGLPAMITFLNAQRTPFQPAEDRISKSASGQSVVTVRFDAPGPMGLGGS